MESCFGLSSSNSSSTSGNGGDGNIKVTAPIKLQSKLKRQQQQQQQQQQKQHYQQANQNYYTQQRLKHQQQQYHATATTQTTKDTSCAQFPSPATTTTTTSSPTRTATPTKMPAQQQQENVPKSTATAKATHNTPPSHLLPSYPIADLNAIEICGEQHETHSKTLLRQHKTQSRDPTSTLPLFQPTDQLQHYQQHDYSYAYYEPGLAMSHSNIPTPETGKGVSAVSTALTPPPPPNSIRALLSKGKKNKLLVSPVTLQSYQTRYGVDSNPTGAKAAATAVTTTMPTTSLAMSMTTTATISSLNENLYEEINAGNGQTHTHTLAHGHAHTYAAAQQEQQQQLRATATSHSAGSLNQQSLVEEELRRVQKRHHKILGELNLSVEAMLMPDSPPNRNQKMSSVITTTTTTTTTSSSSSTTKSTLRTMVREVPKPTISVTAASGQPAMLLACLPTNTCVTAKPKLEPTPAAAKLVTPSTTTSLQRVRYGRYDGMTTIAIAAACDRDSGFSGSSGASYIGSLRQKKTDHIKCARRTADGSGNQLSSNFRSFDRHTGRLQLQHYQSNNSDAPTSLFARASCHRTLNCARIRAAEDPGPIVPTESKARSFWSRKGLTKFSNLSTSTSSINDMKLTSDKHELNTGACEEKKLANSQSSIKAITQEHTANITISASSPICDGSNNSNSSSSSLNTSKTTTTVTAQLHNTNARRLNNSSISNHGSQIEAVVDSLEIHAELRTRDEVSTNEHTIDINSFGNTATIVSTPETNTIPGFDAAVKLTTVATINTATTSDDDLSIDKDEEQSDNLNSKLNSSGNHQRNSQLRSTFNKAKQHLFFDKWRLGASSSTQSTAASATTTAAAASSAAATATQDQQNNCIGGDVVNSSNNNTMRRASASTMCSSNSGGAHRYDINTPGESPGGRLSRWFSIRRSSSHQYDVGERDNRQSIGSSTYTTDAANEHNNSAILTTTTRHDGHMNAQKLLKMPDVPENDDENISGNHTPDKRIDSNMMILPHGGSRANGTASNAHFRLIAPMLPPAPPGLTQQQMKRRHIIAAIVHSENSYVTTLQRLVNDYMKPLEESSPPVLSATKIATLFHGLPEILQLHKLFRIALAECVRNWDRDEKLGDCFVSAFSKPRTLEIYSGFINNFSVAMELAKMEEKRKSALADFLKVKQISAHDRLSFFGLMVKPVQRFPQFILFLQDLLKYTPQGHHDRMSLQLALTQLELLAELLNERKREAEQYQGFKEMLGRIGGTFNTRSLANDGNQPHYLLREDNVTSMVFNHAGFIVKCKQRRLLLLNDKVICVSVVPKQSHDFGASEKLSFKWMYPVTDVEIVDHSTSATLSRILTAGLNRGGSLKSNSSAGGVNNLSTHSASSASALLDGSPATQFSNGADNLCSEMSTLMYDYEVISRIHELVGSLKGNYKELNTNTTRNVLNTIQNMIQHKDEEMAWTDACCLQLNARTKSGKEETYTFQTQSPNVKKEWITELRLAQLALDANNSPAWETTTATSDLVHTIGQQYKPQKPSNKLPLFVKALPVHKSQHQTEVRCGCYYTIANNNSIAKQSGGNTRRRHKQNYLWICTSDGLTSHMAIYAQHHQQAGNLREIGAFKLNETQITAIEFVKGHELHNSLLGDLVWLGGDSRILIYSANYPEQDAELTSCTVTGVVTRILYHFDTVYVGVSNATMLIYRRAADGLWQLKQPQVVQLGNTNLPVPSLLPINMNIYAACANRVYVLNARSGEIEKSFEVQHGASQQIVLMAHSGIGLWISLKNSTVLCLYHTETFKHLQDINIASSVLRHDGKKTQSAVNNSAVYVTALATSKGLLWVGTNIGIAVTIPLPRLEGVPIISGGISTSCHAHFGAITFLLPLSVNSSASLKHTMPATSATPSVPLSMGDDLPAIDAEPKAKLEDTEMDESTVQLRRNLNSSNDLRSGATSPSVTTNTEHDAATLSPRSSKHEKLSLLDQSLSAKIRASLANSPAFHRKRFRELNTDASARISKTLPHGLGVNATGATGSRQTSATSTIAHGEHGYCDVYGLYGKLIFVKEDDYDADKNAKCSNPMDVMYEGMRRSDPELAAIPGKVSTLDRRLRIKAARPRSLDLSNWSVDSKTSSLYTSSGSEESMGIRLFGVGRSVSRNNSSASHKTSGNATDLGNICEHDPMTTSHSHHDKQYHQTAPDAVTLKHKQKPSQQANRKQKQQQNAEAPRTVIMLMGGRGYWRHVWYNTNASSPSHKAGAHIGGGSSNATCANSPLIANSNDAHIVVWEKKL